MWIWVGDLTFKIIKMCLNHYLNNSMNGHDEILDGLEQNSLNIHLDWSYQ
jgi:hypothetical protein